jgi:hypothetical protein
MSFEFILTTLSLSLMDSVKNETGMGLMLKGWRSSVSIFDSSNYLNVNSIDYESSL